MRTAEHTSTMRESRRVVQPLANISLPWCPHPRIAFNDSATTARDRAMRLKKADSRLGQAVRLDGHDSGHGQHHPTAGIHRD